MKLTYYVSYNVTSDNWTAKTIQFQCLKLHCVGGISERNTLVTAFCFPWNVKCRFFFLNREITVLFFVKLVISSSFTAIYAGGCELARVSSYMYILWKRTCQGCRIYQYRVYRTDSLFLLFTSLYYEIDIELLATPCIKYKFLRQVLCVGINYTTWQEHATLSAGIVLQNIIYIIHSILDIRNRSESKWILFGCFVS